MAEKQPVITNYRRRLNVLYAHTGDVFGKPYDVLYIGAKKGRWDYAPEMFEGGSKITAVEVFPKNVQDLRRSKYFERVIQGDIRYLEYLDLEDFYDVVFWWHGPEHVPKQESKEIIRKLEEYARRYVILGTPWGNVEQGAVEDNYYEAHLSYWECEDFVEMGYRCSKIGKRHMMGSCLVAYKEIK